MKIEELKISMDCKGLDETIEKANRLVELLREVQRGGNMRTYFSNEEKEKAEVILKQLEGMSITSAKKLLKKCKKVILGSTVGSAHLIHSNENVHSPDVLDDRRSENCL